MVIKSINITPVILNLASLSGSHAMGLGHEELDVYRLSGMLSRRGGRGYNVTESSATCWKEPVAFDFDSDFDFDPEDKKT